MLEAGILPDETRKDKFAVSHPHLQALATLWGLPSKDPDFFRKYVNERALCQFLAEYTSVIDAESTSPVGCLCPIPSSVLLCSASATVRFRAQIRSPTKEKKKDVLASPPPQATGIYKTVMRPYKSGDLFASRGREPAVQSCGVAYDSSVCLTIQASILVPCCIWHGWALDRSLEWKAPPSRTLAKVFSL
jgi:hypothetical protein